MQCRVTKIYPRRSELLKLDLSTRPELQNPVEMGHPAYSPVQIPPGFMETRVSVDLPLVSSTILGTIPVAPLNNRLQMLAAPKETVAKPGLFVEVNVEDQGAGIPSYLLDRIFEPFFTTKER